MRASLKCISIYSIASTLLFNIYIFFHLYTAEESSINKSDNVHQEKGLFNKKNTNNEFLVLDWTVDKRHIFIEPDPIKCNFSHITSDYCQSKFHSLVNDTLRLYLIERCSRLSTLTVRWTGDQSRLNQADLLAYHAIHMSSKSLPDLILNNERQQFSTVYILESEVRPTNGHLWHKINFPMWYNLERSYPEPATYFDLKIYLNQLFAPIRVPFSKKNTTAPIVWIISNCRAYNGRHLFVQELMSYIQIDSFGKCLNNIKSSKAEAREQSNSILYSSYKFVLALENSNCEDYVTEKLIDALASTSIPIIASRQRKPDYTRFAPKYSYINVYDYKSVQELADYLNYLSKNETAYNEYLWFRRLPANKYVSSGVIERSFSENLRLADEVLGVNSTMHQWLLAKETSVNKYCKLAQFIYTNDWIVINQRQKIDRPTADEVCLPADDLASYFSITTMNRKQVWAF